MISNGLLELLHTPRTRASEGMKSEAEISASKLADSPLIAKRRAAPLPMTRVTRNPASHCAGSWRHNGEADEKTNCWALWCTSRLPIADQINTGQTQAYGRRNCRVASREPNKGAAIAPRATMYHHQGCPFSRSFTSAMRTDINRKRLAEVLS